MKKSRLAILAPRFGIVDRGVETFTREFVEYLSGDFDIEVISRARVRGVRKVWAVGESNKILQTIFRLHPKLAKIFSKFYLTPADIEMLTFSICCLPRLLFGRYDLLFPQNGVWGVIVCRLVRLIKGTPFIYRSAGGFESQIVRQRPNVYVATTPETASKIENYRSETRVVIIPNGVDVKKFQISNSAKLNLEKSVFVCAGALIPQKRIDLAICAVAKLKSGSLLVLGDGPMKGELNDLGEKLLGSMRFLIKSVSYNQMPSYLRACDVFTLPSLGEPFGIVYLEAMACGLPVVAPIDANRRFIIGRAGVLTNIEDINEYSKVLFDVSRKKWGNIPRNQAMKFSWNKIARQYKKLFQTFLRSSITS